MKRNEKVGVSLQHHTEKIVAAENGLMRANIAFRFGAAGVKFL